MTVRTSWLCALLCAGLVLLSGRADADMEASSNVFWSGHSLTDPPIPPMLAGISAGFGTPMEWNMHSMSGASLQARTRGRPPNLNGWDGYRQGKNRAGNDMDVIAELRSSATVGGTGYDLLIITEVSDFMWWMLEGDTVRLLRHYYENYAMANPGGQAWFYQPWLDIHGAAGIDSWLDYHRAATPIWECVATRVNTSLAHEQRTDSLKFLPAGLAIAALIEQATTGAGLPGITAADDAATLASIFTDLVHLTDTGGYYIALVVHTFTRGESPVGAWAPEGMSQTAARALQDVAWRFYNDYQASHVPLDLPACSAVIRDEFAEQYWRYLQAGKSFTEFAELPWYSRYWQEFRENMGTERRIRNWQAAFAADNIDNPFRFDVSTDAEYWYPQP